MGRLSRLSRLSVSTCKNHSCVGILDGYAKKFGESRQSSTSTYLESLSTYLENIYFVRDPDKFQIDAIFATKSDIERAISCNSRLLLPIETILDAA